MLPEKLSNDVCSLRPRQDRLTFSVLLEIEESGRIKNAEFRPSMIRTAERLTYTTVFKVFGGDRAETTKVAPIVPDLLLMRRLAGRLRKIRVAEGSLDFDLLEPELIYKEGRLHSIATFAQNEAHKVIEEFMVAANVAVASFLSRTGIPSLYRVHPKPAVSDLEKLKETLAHFNILLPKPEKIEARDLQRAIAAAEGKAEEKFVNVQVLRALRLALYSEENQGHYGLAKEEYTHFTSPIRRYPDLVVHRSDLMEERPVADHVRIAPDRRGEVAVRTAREAGVAEVPRVVAGLFEGAQDEGRERLLSAPGLCRVLRDLAADPGR